MASARNRKRSSASGTNGATKLPSAAWMVDGVGLSRLCAYANVRDAHRHQGYLLGARSSESDTHTGPVRFLRLPTVVGVKHKPALPTDIWAYSARAGNRSAASSLKDGISWISP
jgi:hypothetical protein